MFRVGFLHHPTVRVLPFERVTTREPLRVGFHETPFVGTLARERTRGVGTTTLLAGVSRFFVEDLLLLCRSRPVPCGPRPVASGPRPVPAGPRPVGEVVVVPERLEHLDNLLDGSVLIVDGDSTDGHGGAVRGEHEPDGLPDVDVHLVRRNASLLLALFPGFDAKLCVELVVAHGCLFQGFADGLHVRSEVTESEHLERDRFAVERHRPGDESVRLLEESSHLRGVPGRLHRHFAAVKHGDQRAFVCPLVSD